MRAGQRLIEVRTYRDGGQSAEDVAREVVAFLAPAERSLELALYDIRLDGEAAELIKAALVAAQARGVDVRLLYNVSHGGPIPVPPPPQTVARARRGAADHDQGDRGRARPDAPQVRRPRSRGRSGPAR